MSRPPRSVKAPEALTTSLTLGPGGKARKECEAFEGGDKKAHSKPGTRAHIACDSAWMQCPGKADHRELPRAWLELLQLKLQGASVNNWQVAGITE